MLPYPFFIQLKGCKNMSLLFQSLAGRPPVGLIEGEHRVTVITPGGLLNARLDTLQVFINGDLVTRIDNIENNLSQSVWPIARTISLAGPFTGAVAIDGSQDVTLTVTVPPNALPTSAISGLDTQLAGIESDLLGLVDDIADVQGSLAGKVNVGDTVNSALRLSVARDFAINGVINAAAVSFDGSGNVTLTATINDGALSIAKTSGLQSALNAKIDTTLMGVPLGVATLDADGKVPLVQIPPFFDDVLEFNTFSAFPATGESGKFYIDLDTGDIFRWSGSVYVNVGVAAAVSTAALKWFTERTLTLSGKATGSVGIDGSQDVTLTVTSIDVTKSDVGLGNVDNTADIDKPVSTAVQTALDLKANRESPTFTGTVTIPTAPLASNNQIAASTAFVASKVADYAPSKTGLGASGSWSIDITGLAARALLLNNSRDFSLEGIVTAVPVGFDGSGNVVLSTTIANGALTIAKTAGLQTALDNKLDANAVGDTVAPLVGGKVPAQYLDVQDSLSEYPALANFPATGVANRLYLDRSNNRLYRWSVDQYVWVSADANTAVTAQTAARWTTARTLTLSGKVDGSASIDGSANVTLNVTGLNGTKADVGLGNVDNTSDLNKPISTATQTALNLKADLASPTFTGTPSTPTAPVATNTTQIASTAFVGLKVADYAPSKTGSGASGTWDIGITGNAVTATRLATARTIDLTGIVTATGVNFDGSSNISLNTAVADGALSIAKTAGLQTALDARLSSALLGVANGVAQLDASGRVPAGQLPSYVDDVLEFANFGSLPAVGETGKIYITTDNNRSFRWSGSIYSEITASPGTTDAVPEGSTNLYFTTARASAAAPVQSVNGQTGAVVIPTLTDGDKGDITVSSSGGVWTINPNAVSLSKIAQIATNTILGNNTAGNASPAALSPSQVRTVLGIGTAGQLNTTGTGGSIPQVNVSNTWTADQIYTTAIRRQVTGGGWLINHEPSGGGSTRGGIWSDDTATRLVNAAFTGEVVVSDNGSVVVNATSFRYGSNTIWHTGTLGSIASSTDLNTYDQTSQLLQRIWNGSANTPESFAEVIHFPGAATAHALQLAYWGGDGQRYYVRHFNDQNGWGGTSATWRQLWHSGNILNIGTTQSSARTALGLADSATIAASSLRDRSTHTGTQGISTITMNTARILGRTTASSGAVEEVSIGSGLSLSGGVLSATGAGGVNNNTSYTWVAQSYRHGAVDTQQIILGFGWSGGNQRWAQVLEADGDFSFWSYDSAGASANPRLRLDNGAGGSQLFVGTSTLTYGGNTVYHAGNFNPATKQDSLGFTPVQQGGGTSQGTNKIYIGWNASTIRLQVDSTDFAGDWPLTLNASRTTAGTFDIARLPVATSGTSSATQVVRADDTRLSNARTPTAHVHSAADITSGTLAVARGGTGVTTSTGTGDVVLSNTPTFQGAPVATGSNAAWVTHDRTGGSAQAWVWYATGNIMRMFHNSTGDRFTIDSAGNGGFVGAANAARFFTGFDSGIINSMSCSNWFRSNGTTGWFNSTYGVGINAEDSTYVRAYNGAGGAQFLAADFVITSDERHKVGIRDMVNRGRLRPVQYLHKDTMKADIGFVAQEVQKLYPEIVGVRGDGILNLSYPKITAVLSEQVNRLEDESVVLKETIVTMRDELDTLKAQMAELIASLKR